VMDRGSLLSKERIVVKIGSSLLTEGGSGRLRWDWLRDLVIDVIELKKAGCDVLLVSSGAVALGQGHLGIRRSVLKLEEKQASAAVGQILLANAYTEVFGSHHLTVAQLLLTLGDTEGRRQYLNARNTMETLLHLGAIPLINENDTVATQEIRFGDNDRLAARVAEMANADLLILLSDIDGLYTNDPRLGTNSEHIPLVNEISAEIESMAGPSRSNIGSGGMKTKVEAAKIATAAGCSVIIASGRSGRILSELENSNIRCTWFAAQQSPVAARKRWIGNNLRSGGTLVLDRGAHKALLAGKSLLPAGVLRAVGHFDRGDAVALMSESGEKVGAGICAYSSADIERIRGHKTSEIGSILGYVGREEVVHRKDLVLQNELLGTSHVER
jgi:glutamate 5-kinase